MRNPPFVLISCRDPDRFVIRLDREAAARLASESGEAGVEPVTEIAIFYDQGNDEFQPFEGYDHDTERGRVTMHIFNAIYLDVLAIIHDRALRLAA